MKFSLIFENTNDIIPFEVKYNHEMFEWFINKANQDGENCFFNNDGLSREIDQKLNDIHWALSKTNEIYWLLSGENFPQSNTMTDYLDQRFLNRQHEIWVKSQRTVIDIDQLRFSSDSRKSKIGWKLHELYPDEIRKVLLAPALEKLGYIYAYEEVNMTVHRLESIFSKDREYSSHNKWASLGFDNPFCSTMVSNPDRVNFSFGYTFVGRQYFNKWQYWDTDLACSDHYNYETLEWSFQLNLDRPQTYDWSQEFLDWTRKMKVKPVTTQLPIANISNLEKNLADYRKIMYNNAKENNPARLVLN
jgi:hypothetical protein